MNLKKFLKFAAVAAIHVAVVVGTVWNGRSREVLEEEEEEEKYYFENEVEEGCIAPDIKSFRFPELIPGGLRRNTVEMKEGSWSPVSKDWESEQQLRIGGSLASGGYGQVLVAFDAQKREVVLKTVDKSAASFRGEQFVHREVEVMKKLHHPNVVRLLASFESQENMCLVMERASFGSVKSLLRRNDGWLEERLVAKIIMSAARALLSMHQVEIVHRDVKPDNLLIASWKPLLVKLCDFGEAERRGMHDSYLGGTEGYGSPEYLAGESSGPWIDVWSLGVTLYELLFGYLPFAEEDVGHAPVDLEDRVLSEGATDLLLRMLECNPDRRINMAAIIQHPWVLGHCRK